MQNQSKNRGLWQFPTRVEWRSACVSGGGSVAKGDPHKRPLCFHTG